MKITVGELIEKLKEYSPSLVVAIDEKFIAEGLEHLDSHTLWQDINFRVEKFEDDSSPKPYYKLILEPIRE